MGGSDVKGLGPTGSALKWFRKAAEQGDAEGQGQGVQRDYIRA
jgi:TPR repeat protein